MSEGTEKAREMPIEITARVATLMMFILKKTDGWTMIETIDGLLAGLAYTIDSTARRMPHKRGQIIDFSHERFDMFLQNANEFMERMAAETEPAPADPPKKEEDEEQIEVSDEALTRSTNLLESIKQGLEAAEKREIYFNDDEFQKIHSDLIQFYDGDLAKVLDCALCLAMGAVKYSWDGKADDNTGLAYLSRRIQRVWHEVDIEVREEVGRS